MTTGRASVVLSECSSWRPRSSSSALALSSSTTARRTAHTLIGSYGAVSTSTAAPPEEQRRSPSPPRACPRRGRAPGAGPREPHKACFVLVGVLPPLANDGAAVDASRERRPERRLPALRPPGDDAHRLGGRRRR